jgi:hypothetical protein
MLLPLSLDNILRQAFQRIPSLVLRQNCQHLPCLLSIHMSELTRSLYTARGSDKCEGLDEYTQVRRMDEIQLVSDSQNADSRT